jgi:hypothetical protein
MAEQSTGLLTPFRGSASDTLARFPWHLSCGKARPATPAATANCRQVQQATRNPPGTGDPQRVRLHCASPCPPAPPTTPPRTPIPATPPRRDDRHRRALSLRSAPMAFRERNRACFEGRVPKARSKSLTSGSLATYHLTSASESRAVCPAKADELAPSARLLAAEGRRVTCQLHGKGSTGALAPRSYREEIHQRRRRGKT